MIRRPPRSPPFPGATRLRSPSSSPTHPPTVAVVPIPGGVRRRSGAGGAGKVRRSRWLPFRWAGGGDRESGVEGKRGGFGGSPFLGRKGGSRKIWQRMDVRVV